MVPLLEYSALGMLMPQFHSLLLYGMQVLIVNTCARRLFGGVLEFLCYVALLCLWATLYAAAPFGTNTMVGACCFL
jgi:hypothetical protein